MNKDKQNTIEEMLKPNGLIDLDKIGSFEDLRKVFRKRIEDSAREFDKQGQIKVTAITYWLFKLKSVLGFNQYELEAYVEKNFYTKDQAQKMCEEYLDEFYEYLDLDEGGKGMYLKHDIEQYKTTKRKEIDNG